MSTESFVRVRLHATVPEARAMVARRPLPAAPMPGGGEWPLYIVSPCSDSPTALHGVARLTGETRVVVEVDVPESTILVTPPAEIYAGPWDGSGVPFAVPREVAGRVLNARIVRAAEA